MPTIRLDHLSEDQRRAYVLADNRIAELSGWDRDLLAIELQHLSANDLDFDVEITGFETAEIDLLIEAAEETGSPESENDIPELSDNEPTVSRLGDLWLMGNHRLLCGDVLDSEACTRLMIGARARMVFTDPPYNVAIDGHVCGLGKTKHREFAMGSGEMSEAQFTEFLTRSLENLTDCCLKGGLRYTCMDWRHALELLQAGREVNLDLLNICVWNKSNGGMGSFYRSKHELVIVFKTGSAPHLNTIELGPLRAL